MVSTFRIFSGSFSSQRLDLSKNDQADPALACGSRGMVSCLRNQQGGVLVRFREGDPGLVYRVKAANEIRSRNRPPILLQQSAAPEGNDYRLHLSNELNSNARRSMYLARCEHQLLHVMR